MIVTLGIPVYHASLATIPWDTSMLGEGVISCVSSKFIKYYLDLKAIVPAWEAVRHSDTVLLAYVICHLADCGVDLADAPALRFTAPL